MSRRLLILIGLGGSFLEVFLPRTAALIPYGTGPSDLNNAQNTTPPANGAPWYNLVQFGQNNASGVYLGNGYVLTAHHVSMVDSGLVINGVSYNRDTSFTPLQITENEGTTAYADFVDLKLIKILGSPPLPVLQNLPLNFSSSDLSLSSTLMGWGVGKGSIISNQGWYWGGDNTRAQRWGTSTTASTSSKASYSGYEYDALRTNFYRLYGSDTSEIALGDSGGGLFQKFSGTWKLSGITTSVLQYLSGAAQYDGILGGSDQPDAAEFVRISRYGYLLRYENWASAKLGSPTASATADPDGDGVKNLIEYASQTNPSQPSVTALPQVGKEGDFLTLTYTQLLSATDLNYAVEESSNLTDWLVSTVITEVVSTSGLTQLVKAKVAINGASQKFLRLRVTRLP